ncbi:MAG: hypothetical protein QXH65_03860 [Thermofilaceae archaeon]
MRRVLPALLAAAAVLAALLFFHGGQLKGTSPTGVAKIIYLLTLEVNGLGRLLVNGSSQSIVNSTRPFTAVVEAVPDPCHTLKQLLVNGTPVEGSRVELAIRGNTTVRAVFERPLHTLSIVANAANASALVNGTLHTLPVELSLQRCSVVNVTPVAPRRYMPLNGSTLLTVEGDTTLTLVFRRVEAEIELKGVLIPIQLITQPPTPINGTFVASDAVLGVPLNTTLYLYPYGVDRAGCVAYNETHRVCLAGWIVNGSPVHDRYYRFNASSDTLLEQLVVYAKRLAEGAWMEVLTPAGPVRVEVNPWKYLVVPFDGEAKYLGDGWLEVKGAYDGYSCWAYNIEVPPWRKLRIHVEASWEGVRDPAVNIIEVVIRNDDLFFSAGYYFGPGEYIFEVDSGILTALYNLFPVPGGNNTLFDITFSKYFTCLYNRDGQWVSCGPAYTARLPRQPKEGVRAGWLYISGNGLLRIKIEVLEGG